MSLAVRRVVLAGTGSALGEAVEQRLRDGGAEVVGVGPAEVDLADAEATAAFAPTTGDVDGVLHLVGGWRGGAKVESLSAGDLAFLEERLWRTVVNVTRAWAPALRAAGERGRFAMVSSAQAVRPQGGNAAYGALKAAAEAWTTAFAHELAETGGTANVVAVNALVTPAMRADAPDKPFASFTDVDEVAEALVWLCTDAARKVNGQRLALHGPGV